MTIKWKAKMESGNIYVVAQSDSFDENDHDEWLLLTGCYSDNDEKMEHAKKIADKLNSG